MPAELPRAHRLRVKLQVHVHGVDRAGKPFDASVGSDNVSRTGLMFRSPQDIEVGSEMDIVVRRPPLGGREFPPLFTRGKAVRVIPCPEEGGYDVALHFIGPQFRTYVGETA